MDRKKLQSQKGRGKCPVFLVALVCFFMYGTLFSYAKEYKDGHGVVVGTDDSRLVATIIETEFGIAIQVIGVGKMTFDVAEYAFFVNPSELVMSDKTFTNELTYSKYNENPSMFTKNIDIAGNLVKNGGKGLNFQIQGSTGYRAAGVGTSFLTPTHLSSVAGMDALVVSIFDTGGSLQIPENEINVLFTCYFKKKNPGRDINYSDIGVGVSPNRNGEGLFCPKWVNSGLHLTYATNEIMYQEILPKLFTYRSPSSVAITGLGEGSLTTATVNANFKRGDMAPANNLLDGYKSWNATTVSYNGRLNWDEVTERGFIYTEGTVDLSVKEYSDILLINGVEYPFPTQSDITAGQFTRNGITFYIVSEPNSDPTSGSVNYSATLTDLSLNTYSVWPYIKYKFETSRIYPSLGDSIQFTPTCNSILAPEAQDQSFCGATVADLVASVPQGTVLKWYSVSVGGEPLPGTDPLKTGIYYARAVDGSCASPSVAVNVMDGGNIGKPTAVSPQLFCTGTVADLKATGVDYNIVEWFTQAEGGTALPSNTPLSDGIYYASQRAGVCQSTERAAVQVIVGSIPVPEVQDQSFCGTATVSDLIASVPAGVTLNWYDVSAGENPLSGTTPLNAGVYYVRATQGSCSSSLVQVNVTEIVLAKPVAVSPQTFCEGTVADLKATGSDGNVIQWYTQAQGGVALPSNTPLSSGVYYASQRADACESTDRTPVQVTVIGTIPAPQAQAQSFCGTATISDLVATVPAGTVLKWYDVSVGGNPLLDTAPLGSGVYYARAINSICSSPSVAVNVTVIAIPAKPAAVSPQTFCEGATVTDLKATGNGDNIVEWYTQAQGGVALPSNTPLSNGVYYTSQRTGDCASTDRTPVQVNVIGTIPAPQAQDQSFCGTATVSDLVATVLAGTELKWYNVPVGGNPLQGTTSLNPGVYYARAVNGSCSSSSFAVNVLTETGLAKPTAVSPQIFCEGTVADLKATGSDDNIIEWYEQSQGGVVLSANTPLSEGVYYASQRAGACVSTERVPVQVSIGNPAPGTIAVGEPANFLRGSAVRNGGRR